jgi:hypothetical protein
MDSRHRIEGEEMARDYGKIMGAWGDGPGRVDAEKV